MIFRGNSQPRQAAIEQRELPSTEEQSLDWLNPGPTIGEVIAQCQRGLANA